MRLMAIAASFMVLAGLLLSPGPAGAGGWSVVSLDQVPTAVTAGEEFTIGFRVLRHGQPSMKHTIEGLEAYIEATHQETGRQITFPASNTGEPGHYSATIVLPEAGNWDWAVVAFDGPHPMYPLEVVQPARPAGSIPEGEARPSRVFWDWMAIGSGVGAGLALLATAGVATGIPGRRATRNE